MYGIKFKKIGLSETYIRQFFVAFRFVSVYFRNSHHNFANRHGILSDFHAKIRKSHLSYYNSISMWIFPIFPISIFIRKKLIDCV